MSTTATARCKRCRALLRVSFKFTEKMSLADKTGAVAKALGGAKVGKTAEAWLVIAAPAPSIAATSWSSGARERDR